MKTGPLTIPTARYQLEYPVLLRRGWHRLRIRIRSRTHIGVRKQLRIIIGGRSETLAWNDSLRETLVVHLDQPAEHVRFEFRFAQGVHDLERFTLRRVSPARATANAVSAKLMLLNQFNCLTPVLKRGGRLLLQGRFREFGMKLMKGLPDSRELKIEAKRAAEATASWWRRRSLSTEQVAMCQTESDAIEDPTPLAILLPVDATRVDHARQSIFSVLRQIHPHWQLRVLWHGDRPPKSLTAAIRREDRARIVTAADGNLATALQQALAEVPCDVATVLAPDDELAEHAVLRWAQGRATTVPVDVRTLANHLPERAMTAVGIVKWFEPQSSALPDGETVVFPLDTSRAAAFVVPQPAMTARVHVAANLVGISGWDAVAFQVLKGFTSRGVLPLRHPAALVKSHVLPPGLSFAERPRTATMPQLVIAAPFQVKPFAPDDRTAVLTMWECDTLAPADVKELNKARVVIVPSVWSRDTFRKSGVTTAMEIVPLGADPLIYHPHGEPPATCTFGLAGALGAGGMRKNLFMAIDAFRSAFPTEDDVKLHVKITPNCPPLDLPPDDRIIVTRAVLPAGAVAEWYRGITAYVNPSKAEGFGLHLMEAMACGVPVVSTAVSGVADYMDNSVGWVLPHTTEPVRNDYYHGNWYPPDRSALVTTLRDIYQHGVGQRRNHAIARASRFTWRQTIRQLHGVLAKHGLLEALG